MKRLLLMSFFWSSQWVALAQGPSLSIDRNGRLLTDGANNPILLIGDTGWQLPQALTREEAIHYIETRAAQGFNTLAIAAVFGNEPMNAYGDQPFELSTGKPDPARPAITNGESPSSEDEYDYWDHLDFVLGEIASRDLYVVLVINFNGWVVGSGNGKNRNQILYDEDNAYAYGYFVGDRYKKYDNLMWMMGGDRSAVYGEFDYTEVFRAMAEGCVDGIKGTKGHDGEYDASGVLMSYHPQKANPNSSRWFHKDEWLTFNSIQSCPSDLEALIQADTQLSPKKPTWLFEGRYEHYTYAYKAWHVRFQAYLSLFAGGFGHIYGNEAIWDFDPTWKIDLQWDGALQMGYLHYLLTDGLTNASFGDLRPADDLLLSDPGHTSAECWQSRTMEAPYSDRLAVLATSDQSTVVVYAADGRTVQLDRARLPNSFKVYIFSPRTGRWSYRKEINGRVALDEKEYEVSDQALTFDFPGEPSADNDWVLLLEEK